MEQILNDNDESFAKLFEASLKQVKEGEIVNGQVVSVGRDTVAVDIGFKSEGLIPIAEFFDEHRKITVKPGDKVEVLLERIEDDDGRLILSKEKAIKMKAWDDLSKVCKEDSIIDGKIVGRVKGGLSVDIGIKAFLPSSQIDVRPIKNLDSLLGKTFKFKVLKFNRKQGNVVLSRRALLEKEREEQKGKVLGNIETGQIVEGYIKNITEYGAFVDLGGIDGLLHITDMSWGRISHPSELFTVGDRVKVKVLKFDPENKRVSLGYKQIAPDPWNNVEEKYPVGAKVRGKVVNITDYGVFIELEEGVEGLIHVSEMSWTRKVKHPSKILSVGEVVDSVVLDVDKENKRIALGLKQTEPNPWEALEQKYPGGTRIQGEIKSITDFGIFIGVEGDIDGLIHISDISWSQKFKHPSELYKKGQVIDAVVLNIDKENEKFSLGIKQLTEDPWVTFSQNHNPGDVLEGKVTNVTDFGAFVELGEGIEGLLHVSEMAKERVDDPRTILKDGQTVSTMILQVDPKNRKVALSIKALEEHRERSEIEEFVKSQGKSTTSLGEVIEQEKSEAAASEKSTKSKKKKKAVEEEENNL